MKTKIRGVMLTIIVPGLDLFDEETSQFVKTDDVVLQMEHSLLSLSKWESEFEKPFLSGLSNSPEELFAYIRSMILTPVYPPDVFSRFTQGNIDTIQTYIQSKQSATTFGLMPETKGRGETITAELIYYWMVGFNIPFECEAWHLNRLFSLIRICNLKQSKPKKTSKTELARQRSELNRARKEQMGTRG